MSIEATVVKTRKCPLRGHCLAPQLRGGPRVEKNQEVIPKFFKCIFFTLNTYQETFIRDILRYDLKLYSVTDGLTNGRTDRREV